MSASGDESKAAPTSSACLEDLLAQAVGAVRRAAAFALDPGEELRVEAKAHRNDLVTQVDRGVEARIAGCLEATGIPIHGEEAHRVEDFETYRGRAWVLEPIDGTLNYVSTHRDWAISLALVDDGVPVLAALADPVAGRLYTAVRGRGARIEPLTGEAVGCDGVASKALEPVKDLPLSEGMVIAHYQLTQHAGIGRAIEGSRGMRCYGAAALRWRRWPRAVRWYTPSRCSSPGTLRPVRCCAPRPVWFSPGWMGRPSTCVAPGRCSWAALRPTPRCWSISALTGANLCSGRLGVGRLPPPENPRERCAV